MPKLLATTAALLLVNLGAASAAPARPPQDTDAPIILAANGCGPGYFRTIDGECVPNARVRVGPGESVVLPPPCPRGYRRDPDPRRPLCYPVY